MDTDLGHVQVHDADLVSFLDDLPRVLSRAVVLGRFGDDLLACKLGTQRAPLIIGFNSDPQIYTPHILHDFHNVQLT